MVHAINGNDERHRDHSGALGHHEGVLVLHSGQVLIHGSERVVEVLTFVVDRAPIRIQQ